MVSLLSLYINHIFFRNIHDSRSTEVKIPRTSRNNIFRLTCPEDHLVREVEAPIDFSFIYSLVKGAYSDERGRPSIDSLILTD